MIIKVKIRCLSVHYKQVSQKFGVKSNLHKNEIPLKIKLCCEEWLPESGLVTAALKIRRKKIQEYYSMDINLMHGIEKAFN